MITLINYYLHARANINDFVEQIFSLWSIIIITAVQSTMPILK